MFSGVAVELGFQICGTRKLSRHVIDIVHVARWEGRIMNCEAEDQILSISFKQAIYSLTGEMLSTGDEKHFQKDDISLIQEQR